MKRVLLFARDPGGANTIIPLVEPLKEKGYYVVLYGKDAALKRYEKFNLDYKDIRTRIRDINQEELKKFLKDESPDFIITGTSADDFVEKFLWKASNDLNIPSFAILDQWTNYGIRFSEFSVSDLEKYNSNKKHPFLPTKILVMDEHAKKMMIEEGIEDERIIISGQPYFDYLKNKVKSIQVEDIKRYRTSIECEDTDFLITFASEPILETYKENNEVEYYWGFSEITIFNELITAVKNVLNLSNKKVKLLIKLHPNENSNNYNDLIKIHESENISIILDKEVDPWLLIKASDLVCGMSSMFLIESALLRRPTMSIFIGLSKENPFILDQKNILKSILDQKTLEQTLENYILKNQWLLSKFDFNDGSTKKIIDFMEVHINEIGN